MKKRSMQVRVGAVALVVCFAVSTLLAAAGAPELPDPGKAPISKQDQEKLGLQAAAEVYKQMPVLPDSSPETQYIRKVGQKLVSVIPQQYNWPFEFHVVQQKEINAFALPGGQMFVNVGTITSADNEAQLAGVMAHEMSHVYMMHSAKQMEKAQWTSLGAGILGAVLGNSAAAGLARAGIQIGAGTLMMKYSRGDEAQADAVGAIILYKAGYNPMAMADFFQKLASQGGSGPQFLSDHPNPGNRQAAIQKEIAPWPQKSLASNGPNFASAKQHAMGVKAYDAQTIANGAKSGQWAQQNAKSGATPKNLPPPTSSQNGAGDNGGGTITNVSLPDVRPSGNFKNLNLDFLSIEYPDNWQVMQDQQQGAGVTIAPKAGVSGSAVAYGTVINGASPQNGQQMNLDQMTSEIVNGIIQGNGNGTKAVGKPQSINVNGVNGRSVELLSQSPIQGQNGEPLQERDWLVTVPRSDGSVIYLVFVAPGQDFDNLRPTFQSMLKSLRVQ